MPCLARFNPALFASHSKVSTREIQTPLAPVVHPKMISGNRVPFRPALRDATSPPVFNAEFGLRIVAADVSRLKFLPPE